MITFLINKYKVKLNNNLHFKEILFGSANTLILKVLGILLGLGVTLFISKKYGAAGIGLYNLSVRTITFLALISTLGINTAILRYVGQFNNKRSEYKLKLLFKHSIQIILPFSILAGLLLFITSDLIANGLFHNINYKEPLRIFSIILPFLAILNISVQYIRGLRFIKVSESLRSVLRPVVIIILLSILGFYIDHYLLPFFTFSIAVIISTLISIVFIYKKNLKIRIQSNNYFTKNELLKTSMPMLVISMVIFLQTNMSIYFLEAYTSTYQVGIFSVSLRLASLISLVLIAIKTISAPKFSELYWSNQHIELQKIIFHSSKLMFAFSIILSVMLVLFSHNMLQVFGNDFVQGKTTILILIIGYVISSISGSTGILLNMTGHQKSLKNILLLILPISLLLNMVLVPIYGINGAALANMITLSLSNILPAIYCVKKLNLITFYIPYISKMLITNKAQIKN